MGLINSVKGIFQRQPQPTATYTPLFFETCAKEFGVMCAESASMSCAISKWNSVFQGSQTQIMKTVCHEAAKLTLTDIDITAGYDKLAKEEDKSVLNDILNRLKAKLAKDLEVGIALGGLMFKANPDGVDIIAPTNFIPVSYSSTGDITSVIFIDRVFRGGFIYTKLEYHRYQNNKYMIDSKVYISKIMSDLGSRRSLSDVPEWSDISEHVEVENLETPLFSYFRMPGYNNVDESSPLGISLCSASLAYMRTFDETFEGFRADLATTRKVIFVNNSSLINIEQKGRTLTHNPIPNLIVGINGDASEIKEFNPSCNVESFKTALQMLLDLISTSCGFTAGYFSFDNVHSAVTATQVESEDQITIATIMSIRDSLTSALGNIFNALYNVLLLYKRVIINKPSFSIYMRDLSSTPEADKLHTLELVKLGYYPLRLYLKEYEGLTDEEVNLLTLVKESPESPIKP